MQSESPLTINSLHQSYLYRHLDKIYSYFYVICDWLSTLKDKILSVILPVIILDCFKQQAKFFGYNVLISGLCNTPIYIIHFPFPRNLKFTTATGCTHIRSHRYLTWQLSTKLIVFKLALVHYANWWFNCLWESSF